MHWIILLIYNIVSLIAVPTLALIRWIRKGEKARLFPKLRNYPNAIWFHASSVGEINAIKALIAYSKEKLPGYQLVVSTVTTTGQQTASGIKSVTKTILFPFDYMLSLLRFVMIVKPRALIIAETEMWPNLLLVAGWFGIPVVIVNGRLTDKSVKPYSKTAILWRPLWENVNIVCAQSEADAARYLELGFEHVNNTGNLKFAIDLPDYDVEDIRSEWGFDQSDFIVAVGSSRPGEEELTANAFKSLVRQYPNLKIVVAPRHLNRLREAMEAFSGLDAARLSEGRKADILVIDSMGILNKAYAICDIAIVGGSFFDFGGHNPLEPAFYRKPVVMGPYHSSCADTVRILQENSAIRIVPGSQLVSVLDQFITGHTLRNQMGLDARMTLDQNAQSLQRNFEAIQEALHEERQVV